MFNRQYQVLRTNTLNLEAWQGWVQHGQVGFAARTREGSRHEVFLSSWSCDAHDLKHTF